MGVKTSLELTDDIAYAVADLCRQTGERPATVLRMCIRLGAAALASRHGPTLRWRGEQLQTLVGTEWQEVPTVTVQVPPSKPAPKAKRAARATGRR